MAACTAHLALMIALLGFGCAIAQTIIPNSTFTFSTPDTLPSTHAPFPTATVIPLPPQFSDIPKDAIACWDSHANYSSTSSFLAEQIRSGQVYTSYSYPTPSVSTTSYALTWEVCDPVKYVGLTTLCDGYPRASDCITRCTPTPQTTTRYYTMSGTDTWFRPTWATELKNLPVPSCTVAPDFSPVCKRLAEAYTWRLSQASANSTATKSSIMSLERPGCSVLVTPTTQPQPPTRPKCSFKAGSYEAYFWPTAQPTDKNAFCNPNATFPTGTPTITGQPNTATTSGLTMTSPYVYHLLHNVTIYTVHGYRSQIGSNFTGREVYSASTTVPFLTLSQPSTSILSQSKECHKSGHGHGGVRYCTISFNPNFLVQDLFTVNAEHYYKKKLATPTMSTICQKSYRPTVALPLTDVAAQNGIGEECQWMWEPKQTRVVGPDVVTFDRFESTAYHPITTTQGS